MVSWPLYRDCERMTETPMQQTKQRLKHNQPQLPDLTVEWTRHGVTSYVSLWPQPAFTPSLELSLAG